MKDESAALTHVGLKRNQTHCSAPSHPAPAGNLQEEKVLHSGAETEGAFGRSSPLEGFVLKNSPKEKETHHKI